LPKDKNKSSFKRNFCNANLLKFKAALNNVNWNGTLAVADVDLSFDKFWETFSLMYELHFLLTKTKFNRNIHKQNEFMTSGLLISHKTKNTLLKIASKDRTDVAWNNYKKYCNLFNSLVRLSKKMYFTSRLNVYFNLLTFLYITRTTVVPTQTADRSYNFLKTISTRH